MTGLARLLVLEQLGSQDDRDIFLIERRKDRARPEKEPRSKKIRDYTVKGDLKAAEELAGLQMSEYDVLFHIPYGPGIDAQKIERMVYRTDLGLNSTFNPKNKGRRLHRHPAFFGTMAEAIEDCCEVRRRFRSNTLSSSVSFQRCPAPETEEEKEAFAKECEMLISTLR